MQHQCQPKWLLFLFLVDRQMVKFHMRPQMPACGPLLRMILAFILYWGWEACNQSRKKSKRAPLNLLGCSLGEQKILGRTVVLILKLSITSLAPHQAHDQSFLLEFPAATKSCHIFGYPHWPFLSRCIYVFLFLSSVWVLSLSTEDRPAHVGPCLVAFSRQVSFL